MATRDPDQDHVEAAAAMLRSLLYQHSVDGFEGHADEQTYGRFLAPIQLFIVYAAQGEWDELTRMWQTWRQHELRLWAKVEGLLIDEETGEPHHFSELGNSRRFLAQHHEDVRYCDALGWLVWDGRRWVKDQVGQVMEQAKGTVRAIYTEAGEAAHPEQRKALAKHALRSESHRQMVAMVELAKSDPRVAAPVDAFDADPYLLTVLNGTLDLRTATLHPHRREDLSTKLAPVSY